MIEHHLRDFLRDDTDITARVAHRIYPGRAPQKTRGELLIITAITSTPVYDLSGESGKTDHTVQITAYAGKPKAAATLSALVRNRLSGYRGAIGDGGASSVSGNRIINAGAGEVKPEDGSDKWTFTHRLDFSLFETTDIPTLT